jgi:hypothetical protein
MGECWLTECPSYLPSCIRCILESTETRGVSHCGLAIYIKKKCISMQKMNYGNSNISPFKNIIFKKSSKGNQNPSRYYNSITKLEFQHKPKYHLSKILT